MRNFKVRSGPGDGDICGPRGLVKIYMCHGQGCRVFLGMGKIPPFNRNPYNGYINPYYWVEFPIPYDVEIIGV